MDQFGAIRFASRDRLQRRAFAGALADLLFNLRPSNEGYVVGIEGEWGSGKSSVVNMTLERLKHKEMSLLSRSPFYYDDPGAELSHDQLDAISELHTHVPEWNITIDRDYFCRDVVKRGLCAETADEGITGPELYRYFRLEQKYQSEPTNLCFHFQPWLVPDSAELATAFINDLAITLGSRFGTEVEDSAEEYRKAVAELAPLAGAAADFITPGVGAVLSNTLNYLGHPQAAATLDGKKRRLERALSNIAPRKVIVVIDDLDRLLPSEAAEMISVLKGLGRLPNVVYLVSYDEGNLASLISAQTKLDGRAYLEKIIQYKRPLPLLPDGATSILIDTYLDKSDPPIVGNALSRLQETWIDIISKEVTTPRDAIRVGNSFLSGWNMVGQHIDASDFLILQLILHKDPDLYKWIERNLDTLCGSNSIIGQVGPNKISDLVKNLEPKTRLRQRALANLFPEAAKAMGTYGSSGINTARIDRRLQVYEYRYAYFDLSSPTESISRSNIRDLIVAREPLRALRDILTRIEGSRVASQLRAGLLDDLRNHYGDGTAISFEMAHALVAVSADLIRLRDESTGFFSEDNARRLSSILVRGLDATPTDQRAALLLKLITKASDYSLMAAVTRTAIGALSGNDGGRSGLAMDEKGRQQAVSLLMKEIRKLAASGKIFDQARPSTLVWFWHTGEPNEVRQFIDTSARSERYFPSVVDIVVGTITSSDRGRYEVVSKEANQIATIDLLDSVAAKNLRSGRSSVSQAAKRYFEARRNDDEDAALSTSAELERAPA